MTSRVNSLDSQTVVKQQASKNLKYFFNVLGIIILIGGLVSAGCLYSHMGYSSFAIGGAAIAFSLICFLIPKCCYSVTATTRLISMPKRDREDKKETIPPLIDSSSSSAHSSTRSESPKRAFSHSVRESEERGSHTKSDELTPSEDRRPDIASKETSSRRSSRALRRIPHARGSSVSGSDMRSELSDSDSPPGVRRRRMTRGPVSVSGVDKPTSSVDRPDVTWREASSRSSRTARHHARISKRRDPSVLTSRGSDGDSPPPGVRRRRMIRDPESDVDKPTSSSDKRPDVVGKGGTSRFNGRFARDLSDCADLSDLEEGAIPFLEEGAIPLNIPFPTSVRGMLKPHGSRPKTALSSELSLDPDQTSLQRMLNPLRATPYSESHSTVAPPVSGERESAALGSSSHLGEADEVSLEDRVQDLLGSASSLEKTKDTF